MFSAPKSSTAHATYSLSLSKSPKSAHNVKRPRAQNEFDFKIKFYYVSLNFPLNYSFEAFITIKIKSREIQFFCVLIFQAKIHYALLAPEAYCYNCTIKMAQVMRWIGSASYRFFHLTRRVDSDLDVPQAAETAGGHWTQLQPWCHDMQHGTCTHLTQLEWVTLGIADSLSKTKISQGACHCNKTEPHKRKYILKPFGFDKAAYWFCVSNWSSVKIN